MRITGEVHTFPVLLFCYSVILITAMRILYVSGGSAGHLAPLIAVERAMKESHPHAESVFVCSHIEDDISFLKKEGVHFQPLPLPRRPLYHPIQFVRSIRTARAIIETFKPDVIFSKGSIVSIPICFVAHRKNIPIVLHESDAVMGRANRLVARWATKVCTGFPIESKRKFSILNSQFSINPVVTTGNPIRPSVTSGSKAEGIRITKLSGKRPTLLVIGGSQGAQALNEAVYKHIDALLAHVDIVHVTGKGKQKTIHKNGYWSVEFAHEELPHLYALATLALSRAGAGTIGELAANGIPTVLVPIVGLANNHQVLNAESASRSGGCILVEQPTLHTQIVSSIVNLAEDQERLSTMSKKIRNLYNPEAARRIADIVAGCLA